MLSPFVLKDYDTHLQPRMIVLKCSPFCVLVLADKERNIVLIQKVV
jgi:hypothetical protein